MDEDEEYEKIFEEDAFDDLFSESDGLEDLELGDILVNITESNFESPRKMVIGTNLIEISYPQKKRLRSDVYHAFRLKYSDIRSYEVIKVKAFQDRESVPIDSNYKHKKYEPFETGEVFIYGFSPDETDWFVFDVFIPLDMVNKINEILKEKSKRPPLPGISHYGNLAAIHFALNHCKILYQHKLDILDWAESSMFMRERGGKYEKYSPKNSEISPPTLYICKEGFGQVFSENDPPVLQQMSTFWPWSLINEISEEENKIKIKWVDELYIFRQQIADDNIRKNLLNLLQKTLKENRNKKYDYAPFIRSNSFPNRNIDSWKTAEPFGCEVSRSGFPKEQK